MKAQLIFKKNDKLIAGEDFKRITIDLDGDPGIVEEVKGQIRRFLIQVKKDWEEY